MKKALMVATVASMIDLFNMDNIKILQEKGYEVHIACNFKNGNVTDKKRMREFIGELKERAIKFYHIPVPRKIYAFYDILKSCLLIMKLCEENQYQIIHCHSPIGGAVARLAGRYARKKGTKVIYTAHGFHFYKGAPLKYWLLYYPAERFLAKYTDVLITINKEDYLRASNFKNVTIKYMPGVGIDTDKFSTTKIDEKQKEAKRNEMNIKNGDVILLSVGELTERKNHKAVIEALSKINYRNFKYFICGQGELRDELDDLVKQLGLEKQVELLGYRTDILEISSISDIFIFPSLQEGLPMALMEAMAMGLPVICTDIRGNNDLICDGLGGYLYKINDIRNFTIKLKLLINNQALRKEMGIYNHKNVLKYDIKFINSAIYKIYDEISK